MSFLSAMQMRHWVILAEALLLVIGLLGVLSRGKRADMGG
jgi:hypothetical protein